MAKSLRQLPQDHPPIENPTSTPQVKEVNLFNFCSKPCLRPSNLRRKMCKPGLKFGFSNTASTGKSSLSRNFFGDPDHCYSYAFVQINGYNLPAVPSKNRNLHQLPTVDKHLPLPTLSYVPPAEFHRSSTAAHPRMGSAQRAKAQQKAIEASGGVCRLFAGVLGGARARWKSADQLVFSTDLRCFRRKPPILHDDLKHKRFITAGPVPTKLFIPLFCLETDNFWASLKPSSLLRPEYLQQNKTNSSE